MEKSSRINLRSSSDRGGFSIIYDELWSYYLPHIGGDGALLYCFLKSQAGQDIPNPCSKEWGEAVCKPLGFTILQSHQAWATLQEMGLITFAEEQYVLRDPAKAPDPVAAPVPKEDNLYSGVEARFGRPLSGAENYQLEALAEDYDAELILTAARFAVLSNAYSLPYIKQVLLNWKAKGIATVAQAEEDYKQYSARKAKKHARRGDSRPKAVRATEPDAINYDDEELILKRMIRRATRSDVVSNG